MAGWILPAIDWLRWVLHSNSTPTYDHIQPLDDSQVFDKVPGVLSRPLLESAIVKLFQKLGRDARHTDRGLAQQKCAHACAVWICHQESDDGLGKGTVKLDTAAELSVIKVVSNDCKLKLKEMKNGGVETTVTVQVDSLVGFVSDQRISLLFNTLSTAGFSTWTTELLQTWARFGNAMRPEAMSIVKLILYGDNVRIKIRCKVVKTTIAVILNDKRQGEIIFEVDEINKRTMARLIIWLCGNEGTSHTREQAALRRLIQACISSLEKHNNSCWKDTKVSLYGQDATSFHILAGKSLDPIHIVGFVNSTGEFQIVERHNRFCIIS